MSSDNSWLENHATTLNCALDVEPRDLPAPRIAGPPTSDISLNIGSRVVLGRATNDGVVTLHDATVEMKHCLIARQPGTGDYWLADMRSLAGTFVNGRSVSARRLVRGDVVQVGRFAWVFSSSDEFLLALEPLEGASIRFAGVAVPGRLETLDLCVEPGQFIATVGKSGAGKSTLIAAILGNVTHLGEVRVNGVTADDSKYREGLRYVPQQKVLHDKLLVRQAVEFGARLRERAARPEKVHELMRRLDLPRKYTETPVGELSGGETQRVRVAAELIGRPRLLILDEPAGGLDQARERALMQVLRGLALQGCTVLVVTHGLEQLERFDRVLVLAAGRLHFDGTPEQLRQQAKVESLAGLDLDQVPNNVADQPAPNAARAPRNRRVRSWPTMLADHWRRTQAPGLWRQMKVLLERECCLLVNDPWRQLALPLAGMPLFFAVTLALAVKGDDLPMLGFFSILAAIWMGASLSLMAIVRERDIFDHERLLFLRVRAYLGAKLGTLYLLSAVQSIVFVSLLCWLRLGMGREMLYSPFIAFLVLVLTGWGATGAGLVVSALAGRSAPTANLLLPLFMILQMVFSVQVAGERGTGLADAYEVFSIQAPPSDSNAPNRPGAYLSYATLSRWSDIALSRYSYDLSKDAEYQTRHEYDVWRNWALVGLATWVGGAPIATAIALISSAATTRSLRRAKVWVCNRFS